MKWPAVKVIEHKCPACNGSGFATVMQPVQPRPQNLSSTVYEMRGKGQIKGAANRGGLCCITAYKPGTPFQLGLTQLRCFTDI